MRDERAARQAPTGAHGAQRDAARDEREAGEPEAAPVRPVVRTAGGLLLALERALKSARLYPPGSAVVRELQGVFVQRLRSLLREHGLLALTIDCDEIYLGDDLVYDGGGDERNFAFALFDGGIQELVLHDGITETEAIAFAEALGAGVQSREENVTALLWQHDLRHVSFVTVDLVRDDARALSDDAHRAGRAASMRDRLRDRLVNLEQIVDMRSLGPAAGSGPDPSAAGPSPFELDEETERALAGRVRVLGRDPALGGARAVLAGLLRAGPAEPDAVRLLGMLRRLVPHLADGGDLPGLAALVSFVSSLQRERRGGAKLDAACAEVLAAARRDEVVHAIGEALKTTDDPAVVMAYVRGLGEVALRAVAALLGRSRFDRELVEACADAVGDHPRALSEAAQGPSEAAAWIAARILGERRAQGALSELLRASGHEAPRVRAEALGQLARFDRPQAIARVLEGLADEHADVRARVRGALLASAGGAVAPEVHARVLALVESASFRVREEEEKTALYALLARADPELGVGYLERVLQRFRLLRRQEANTQKRLAIEGLRRAGSDRARAALEAAAKRLGGNLGRACEEALATWARRRRR